MKRLNLIIVLGFLVAAMMISCGGGGSGESEPNNSIEQANSMSLGQIFDIKISPKKDVDWFKVDLQEQGYLTVQASQIPDNLKLQARFSLYQEWEATKDKSLKTWTYLPAVLHMKDPGTYYFAIIDDYGDAESDQNIQIRADFVKEFDASEFNNTANQAVEITNGQVKDIAIYPTGDVDIFLFNADKQGYLKVMGKGIPENIKPQALVFIYDEWSDPKEKVVRNWDYLPSACAIPAEGTYYIKIIDDYHDASSDKLFSVKFDFAEETDMHEPNNDVTAAKQINLGDTLNLMIFPKGDQDFFKFNSGANTKIDITARNFEGIVPETRLYILDSENKLKEAGDWKRIPAAYEIEKNTEYYIVIHDDYNDQSSEKIFEVIIK